MWRKNVGPLDRAFRLTGGAILIAVGMFLLDGLQASVVGLVVAALGLWFMVTGAIGRCPLYVLLGISTLRQGQGARGTIAPFVPGTSDRASHPSSPPDRPERQEQRSQAGPALTRR